MTQMPEEQKGTPEAQLSPQEKKNFSSMVKFFSHAFVQTHTFGIEHPLAKQPIEQCFTLLSNLIQEKGNIALYIAEKKLRYGQTILEQKNPVVDRMIELFTTVQLVSLEFDKGFSREDFLKFLSVFSAKPEDILSAGGVEKLVKEKGVGHLKINPIKYELIGMDEKVVSETAAETTIAQEALDKLEKQLAEKKRKSETEPKEEKPKEKKVKTDELLALIDESLKEEAEQSRFVDKLTANPLEVVNLITEAMRLLNKVGGENAKGIISSIINKLALVGDDLYRCLREGKEEDEGVKETYKAAGMLGYELSKRINNIDVAPELGDMVKQMTSVLTVLMDQIEAQKLISLFSNGKQTLKKKAKLLKKIAQREKTSADFGLLMKNLLVLKGASQEEVKNLLDKKEEIFEELKKEKETSLTQELTPTLQKLKGGQLSVEEALGELKELLGKKKKAK